MTNFNSDYLITDLRDRDLGELDLLEEKGDYIFHGKILTYSFCDFVMERVKKYELQVENKMIVPANSMHENAILTSELNISTCIENLVNLILLRKIHSLFPRCAEKSFDTFHSYIVRYSADMDVGLGFHVDDSLVTINLCLNDKFIGSDIVFEGIRCPIHVDTPYKHDEKVSIKHKKGFMILHDGKNRHYVNSIETGERYNLIIWCQSSDENIKWFNALQNYECMDFCKYQRRLEK
jgi:predicted 2-oxoglutarate/Fe(II)-dependent dioxygenase YbiX